jgi:hypothetical protein
MASPNLSIARVYLRTIETMVEFDLTLQTFGNADRTSPGPGAGLEAIREKGTRSQDHPDGSVPA